MGMSLSVYDRATEAVIAEYGTNIELKLSGSRLGLSCSEWDALIRGALKETMYGTARCLRPRAFDVDLRIKQFSVFTGLK